MSLFNEGINGLINIMNQPFNKYFKFIFLISLLINFNIALALTANEIVINTTQEVLARLEDNKERLKQTPEYIQVIVQELIIPNMDFVTMSELAIGNKWMLLNEDDKTCFSQGFKNLLVERYAYVLLSYRNQNISYQSAKPFGDSGYVAIIQTLTRPNVKPLTIKYPMRPDADSWKVIDLVIDDVSLIRNYRKMFSKEIKHKGLEGFIRSFQECS